MPFQRFVIAATAAVALGVLATTGGAQTIGTIASAEPTLRGTPPGAGSRPLGLGAGVVRNETIASSGSGRGQILFVDQTTLSLAPNTTITLDQFVFNPDGSGQVGLEMTRGALRFIGGTLSRRQEATVTTPTATIGIRGSSALVAFLNGETITVFLAGERLCLSSRNGRACTSRRGGVLTEEGYQGRVNPAFLAQLLGLIDGAPGGGGGGTGLGSGVDTSTPADRGPVSTTGEEFDLDLFEDDLRFDDLLDGLPEEVPTIKACPSPGTTASPFSVLTIFVDPCAI